VRHSIGKPYSSSTECSNRPSSRSRVATIVSTPSRAYSHGPPSGWSASMPQAQGLARITRSPSATEACHGCPRPSSPAPPTGRPSGRSRPRSPQGSLLLLRLGRRRHRRCLPVSRSLRGYAGSCACRACLIHAWQARALRIGATGFEPATFRPPAERATKLRHAPRSSGRPESNRRRELGRLLCYQLHHGRLAPGIIGPSAVPQPTLEAESRGVMPAIDRDPHGQRERGGQRRDRGGCKPDPSHSHVPHRRARRPLTGRAISPYFRPGFPRSITRPRRKPRTCSPNGSPSPSESSNPPARTRGHSVAISAPSRNTIAAM
jgi:hypothetical protein